MAFCKDCGKALKEGEKFCPSCGTSVKGGSSAKVNSKEDAANVVDDGAVFSMGKLALMVVRVSCIAIVVCFFLPYYSINYLIDTFRVSGASTALGIDKKISFYGYSTNVPIPARPALLFVPLLALAVLAVLHVSKVREKVESIKVPIKNVPVIGDMGNFSYVCIIAGLLGLIFLGAAKPGGAAGIGFILTLLAYIAIIAMPFVDKFLLNKKA